MSDDVVLRALNLLVEGQKAGLDLNQLKEMMKTSPPEKKVKNYWDGQKRSDKYGDFLDWFEYRYPSTRRDILRGVAYTKDIDKYKDWEPIENQILVIESECAGVGLSPAYTKRHLQTWITSKEPELLVDVPEWDGKDHIGDALNKISVKNIDHGYFKELMTDWFYKIALRMKNPKVQNRLPVFRGPQGLGKDFAIRAMTDAWSTYRNEVDFKQASKTELYRIIRGLAIAIIPEFDETSKTSVSVLKSVITAESAEIRPLYKNETESVPIRCSFISACNFEGILRDSSGNRRFLIFDISHIEHTFEKVDSEQIMAQSFALAEKGYKPSVKAEAAMKLILSEETPDAAEKLFIEEVSEYLINKEKEYEESRLRLISGDAEGSMSNIPDKIRWHQIAPDVAKIARNYGYGVNLAQSIMKRNGMTHRDKLSTYYKIPDMHTQCMVTHSVSIQPDS